MKRDALDSCYNAMIKGEIMTAILESESVPPEVEHLLLEDVSWEYYEQTLRELEHRRLRITFDDGRMEIMSPSATHEWIKKIIARVLEAYALATGLRIQGFGSFTCKRRDLKKGLEPDECYYVTHSPRKRGHVDLKTDPPPDIAIEVDMASSSIPRQPIYAALGVPELWRYGKNGLTVLHRQPDGTYIVADHSLALPALPMDVFARFVEQAIHEDEYDAIQAMLRWLKER
ncbi:MAG TPA: Uma2 family endonuclease [Tepidisphaeraceae bacterium]